MKNFGFKKFMIFFILSATVALAYQIPYMRYTFYDQMMAALQLTDVQMGILASACAVTNMISYPIGGIIADRFSTKTLIIISLAACTVLTVLHAFTTNYYVLIAIYLGYGFFIIATLWSAYLAGIRDLGDESNQSTLFGSSEATRGIVQTLMGFVFVAVMGAAASNVVGFRNVMLVGAVSFAVILILAILFLPGKKKDGSSQAEATTEPEKRYTYLDVVKNKGVWISILVCVCCYMSWTLGNGYTTTYTTRVLGISESLASTIGIVRTYVIVILAGFLGGWILDRFSYKGKGFIVFLAITAVVIACVIFTNKIVPLCIALTLFMAFVVNVMKSTYWSIMGEAGIPRGMTALATGFMSLLIFLPDVFVPTMCGNWIDAAAAAGNVAAGFNKIFILLIVCSVIGIFASFLLLKRTKALEASGEIVIPKKGAKKA